MGEKWDIAGEEWRERVMEVKRKAKEMNATKMTRKGRARRNYALAAAWSLSP